MYDIDDRYIDYDFTKDRRYVHGDTGVGLFGSYGVYEKQRGAVLSDSDVRDAIERTKAAGGGAERLVTRIYDQKSEGSCTSNATGQSHEIEQAKQYGKEFVIPLAAMSLYQRVASGPSSGSAVSANLNAMVKGGILPLDTPANRERFKHVMPNTGWRTRRPDGWEETASQFLIVEYDIITTLQGLKSALALQQPVVVGRQGHSICLVGLLWDRGQFMAPYPNSWGMDWGSPLGDMKGGFGFDTERQLKMSARWAFTPRVVRAPQARRAA